jgi:hypothetical protein
VQIEVPSKHNRAGKTETQRRNTGFMLNDTTALCLGSDAPHHTFRRREEIVADDTIGCRFTFEEYRRTNHQIIMNTNIRKIGAALLAIGLCLWSANAFAQTTTTTVTSADGAFTEYVPGSQTVVLRSETNPAPVRYVVTKETTVVDETGAPITMERIPVGAPVSLQYTGTGDRQVVSRIVVRRPAAAVSERTTTTTAPVAEHTTTTTVPAVAEHTRTTTVPAVAEHTTTTTAPAVAEHTSTSTTTTTTAPLTHHEKHEMKEAEERRHKQAKEAIEHPERATDGDH